jgi:hypothetical protein
MWAMAAASEFKNSKMEIKKIIDENHKLQEDNKKLQEELEFFKGISSFPNSLVGNMFVKYIDGKKVWVDRQNITHDRELLHKLDSDNDVSQWIDDIDIKFKDNDW